MSKGTLFSDTSPVAKDDVSTIVDTLKLVSPSGLLKSVINNVGSAGFKVQSGDVDLFLDEKKLIKNFDAEDAKQARKMLAQFFQAKGISSKQSGRTVHISLPYKNSEGKELHAQVDIMVLKDASRVADWHQHGPRGMYDDPKFNPAHIYILLGSIAKYLGYKVDQFGGVVMRRDNNEVVADNRNDAAKLLLNPGAKAEDLNSVNTIMKALEGDPDREGKLAQAKQEVQDGRLTLPDEVAPGTAAWFRKLGHLV